MEEGGGERGEARRQEGGTRRQEGGTRRQGGVAGTHFVSWPLLLSPGPSFLPKH